MVDITQLIEQFTTAVLSVNTAQLEELLNDNLSYGHSDGHVEGKKDFIEKLSSGIYQFKTMEITNQEIHVFDDVAVVRHQLDAVTNDENIPGEAHLFVLVIWQYTSVKWQLIARQAVKNLK